MGDAPDPTPLQIIPAPAALPCLYAILVLHGQEIPFGRPYRTHPNGVRRRLTARKRVRPPPALLSDSFSGYSSRQSSSGYLSDRSSSEYSSDHSTSRFSLSSPPPCKRGRVLLPSSSSSEGLSRKRGRLPTTSLSGATCSPSALLPTRADLLPPHKRLRGFVSAFHQKICLETDIEADIKAGTEVGAELSIEATVEDTVEVAVEPDIPPVLPKQTVEEILGKHEYVIQEMYDHLLEMPLQRMEEVEEEIRALTSRLETTKAESTALRNRVRSLELSELSLRDTLRVEREKFCGSSRHLGYVIEELSQSMMSRFADRESFKMIMTFMISHLGYRP
ncbi:hypothetical protein Tco_0847968 [Tanacetum coccineum]